MKKFIGLVLTLTLIFSLLTSCTPSISESIEKADAALLDEPYELEIKISANAENEGMISEIFESMNSSASVYIHKNNFQIVLGMESINMEITFVEDTFYSNVSVSGHSYKQKAVLTEDEEKDLRKEYSIDVPFSEADFEDVTISKNDDGELVIVCKSPKTETINTAISEYFSVFESLELDVELSIDDISYTIIIEDSKYDEIEAKITFTVATESQSFTGSMQIEFDFDYEDGKVIAPPTDKDEYEVTDFSDFIS